MGGRAFPFVLCLVAACSERSRSEGVGRVAEAVVEDGGKPSDWNLAQVGDFNGDGMADMLWHNPRTCRLMIRLMRGPCIFQDGPEFPAPPGEGWVTVNTGDFNLDGMQDVLFYNPGTNRIAVWLLRGNGLLEGGAEIPGPGGGGWVAVNTGNVNDDGMSDVIWFNASRHVMAVWTMSGTHLIEPGPELPGPP